MRTGRAAWALIAIGVLCGSALAAWADLSQQSTTVHVAPTPVALGEFELVDHEGRPSGSGRLRGSNVLVFFGFTHCPEICPATLYKLKLLVDSQRRSGGPVPTVVLISVDGDRDTPAVMKAYLAPLSSEFIGLTGDVRSVRRIAANFSAVFFKGLPADNSGQYLVDHTSQVYLVDTQGRLRATFFDASVEQMLQTTRAIMATGQG